MNYWIKSLNLDTSFEAYKIYNIEGVKEFNLTNLAKINIFVGANNSGKSRFMRLLSSIGQIKFDLNLDFNEIETLKTDTNNKIQEFASKRGYAIQIPRLNKYELFQESSDLFDDVFNVYEKLYVSGSISVRSGSFGSSIEKRDLEALREHLSLLKEKYDLIRSGLPKNLSFKKLYIPSLRGLRILILPLTLQKHYSKRRKC